jgi:hypothetical protein
LLLDRHSPSSAGSDVDDVGIGWIDRDPHRLADRKRHFAIEQRPPRIAPVERLPDTAVGVADVDDVAIGGVYGDGRNHAVVVL